MNITWINPAPIIPMQGGKTSERVCVRLRSMLPGDELARRGHRVEQVFFQDLPRRVRDPRFFRQDVFVFGKAFVDFSLLMAHIRQNSGAKVAIDLCDNVFCPPEDGLKPIYTSMLPHADAVLASSEFLASALHDKIPGQVRVYSIADAVEGLRIDPSFEPCPGLIRLLWFGYPNNLPLLLNELPNLSRLTQDAKVSLSIVSAWQGLAMFPPIMEGIDIKCLQWSPEVMRDEMAACDVVIIPSDDTPARLTKSANRIITAIWAGKFAAAYPLPSYHAFANFAHVDPDLSAGITMALANRPATRERIAAGQRFIEAHYSLRPIGDAWEQTLGSVIHPGTS